MSLRVYWKYFRSGGGCCSFLFFAVMCIFTQVLFSGSDFWLTLWTNAEENRARMKNASMEAFDFVEDSNSSNVVQDGTYGNATFTFDWWRSPDTFTGIYVFTILITSVFIFSMVRTIHYFIMCMFSSVNLHNRMFESIIRAPLLFYDRNPVGNTVSLLTHLQIE